MKPQRAILLSFDLSCCNVSKAHNRFQLYSQREFSATKLISLQLGVSNLYNCFMPERIGDYSLKSVTMCSIEEMIEKLNIHPPLLRHHGVLVRFLTSVADQEETCSTLVAAWQGACQDATRKFRFAKDMALITLLHKYSFPGVLDAIVHDREVAIDAVEELRSLTENARLH